MDKHGVQTHPYVRVCMETRVFSLNPPQHLFERKEEGKKNDHDAKSSAEGIVSHTVSAELIFFGSARTTLVTKIVQNVLYAHT